MHVGELLRLVAQLTCCVCNSLLCVCASSITQLPYLVGNIVEILELKDEDELEDDGANVDLDSHRKGKCTVIKTSTVHR